MPEQPDPSRQTHVPCPMLATQVAWYWYGTSPTHGMHCGAAAPQTDGAGGGGYIASGGGGGYIASGGGGG